MTRPSAASAHAAAGYPDPVTDRQRETSVGATGGLPGENAAPQNSELSDDERDDTVAMVDVAPPENDQSR